MASIATRKLHGRECGQTLVEFAVVAFVMALVFFMPWGGGEAVAFRLARAFHSVGTAMISVVGIV
jgi:hypothetical protein